MRTRVKICGITNAADAATAVAAGADALGVVLAPSPRRVTIDEAARALQCVPPFVARVGVFVDATDAEVAEAVTRLGLTHVQFHGAEGARRCAAAPVPVVRAVRVGPGFDSGTMEPYRGAIAALLVDAYVPGVAGGTGVPLPWDELPALPVWAPLILAGGLTPANVADAVRAVRPFAVDVSSGVEARPRIKDVHAMESFVAAVRAADAER